MPVDNQLSDLRSVHFIGSIGETNKAGMGKYSVERGVLA
jgi:hypothetical protein